MSIPIVATAVPKMPPTLIGLPVLMVTWLPRKKERPRATQIASTGKATHSNPTAIPVMMVVAGAVNLAAAILLTRGPGPAAEYLGKYTKTTHRGKPTVPPRPHHTPRGEPLELLSLGPP